MTILNTKGGFWGDIGGVVAPTFVPSDISGLTLWLKADSLVLNNDDPVTTWADSSGLGNDVTQATVAKKPTYKTNIQNSKPVVRFDGTDDKINGAVNLSTLFSVSAMTAFAVFKASVINTDAANGYENDCIWMHNTNANIGMVLRSTGPTVSAYNFDNGSDFAASNINTTNFFAAMMRHQSGNIHSSINAGSETTTVSGNTSDLNAPVGVGANYNETAFMAGDIAEIIFYNTALSAADIARVYAYLNTKYAIY